MIFPLLIIPATTLIFINAINYLFRANGLLFKYSLYGTSLTSLVKLATLLSMHINLAYSVIIWKEYPIVNNFGELLYPANSWFELQPNLNLPFIILSILILITAVLTSWYSSVNTQLLLNLLLLIEICLIGAFSCVNLFAFLLFFEASAIPVLVLMVYCGSDRRERIKASYYFLFFTLYGSISLLLIIVNVYSLFQVERFFETSELVSNYSMWLLLFSAFAVKIPLFPFHLWLPQAHV